MSAPHNYHTQRLTGGSEALAPPHKHALPPGKRKSSLPASRRRCVTRMQAEALPSARREGVAPRPPGLARARFPRQRQPAARARHAAGRRLSSVLIRRERGTWIAYSVDGGLFGVALAAAAMLSIRHRGRGRDPHAS